jgi:hypothetical protein
MPKELNADQIEALVNSQPRQGVYRQILADFLASDSNGIDVTDDFPGKKLESVANSFKRVKGNHDEFAGIQVIYVSKFSGNTETLALVKS